MAKGRKAPTQRDIARRLKLDPSTVNKILRNGRGTGFNRRTVERVRAAAEAMGYDLGRVRHQHNRGDARLSGRLDVEIVVYDRFGSVVERGTAILVEISRSGARLDRVRLPKGFVPLDGPAIEIRSGRGSGFALKGRLARILSSPAGQGIAVQFPAPLPPMMLDAVPGFRR